jgi:hypothetical protein
MQTNSNLMDEMAKIKRVAKPDMIIFVGDALSGNDAVEQAKRFNEVVGIDGDPYEGRCRRKRRKLSLDCIYNRKTTALHRGWSKI